MFLLKYFVAFLFTFLFGGFLLTYYNIVQCADQACKDSDILVEGPYLSIPRSQKSFADEKNSADDFAQSSSSLTSFNLTASGVQNVFSDNSNNLDYQKALYHEELMTYDKQKPQQERKQ